MLLAVPGVAAAQSDSGAPQLGVGYSVLHEELDGEKFWDQGFSGDMTFVFGGTNGARLGAIGQFTTHRNSDFDDNLWACTRRLARVVWHRRRRAVRADAARH